MRIGLLADATGVSAKTLRFYEDEGLLAEPPRTPGGYRDHPPEAVTRVGFIKRAQSAGLTLAQIRQVLAVHDEGRAPCRHVARLVDDRVAEVDRRLEELERTRAELLTLRGRLERLDPAECDDGDICSAIAGVQP